jgi:L-iditol 2-dehydrogenase
MKAVLLEGPNKLSIKEVETPKCPPGGLLLKVKACGVCGSDIRTIRNGSSKIKKYPVIMGHEITGVVAEVSKDTNKFRIGDKLAVGSTIPCGNCYFCKNGIDNLCPNTLYLGNGRVDYNGGYAEYLAVTKVTIEKGPVTKIPENVSFDEAALAEPMSTVINSHDHLKIQPNDVAVVIGAGPIGALHISLLKLEGIGKTMIADILDERLALTKEACNPDYVVNSKNQSLEEEVKRVTEGRGADIVIVACSSRIAQEQSFSLVRKGGDIVFFGGLPDKANMIQLDSNILHYSQLTLHGTYISCVRHFFKVIDIIGQKKIDLSRFITKMPLDKVEDAIKLAESGKALKVILNP